MASFDIHINFTNKQLRSISIKIAIVAAIGFAIWYVVDYPFKYLPSELRIPYYLDILPNWLLKIFGISITLGLISYLLFDVRSNLKGSLKVQAESVILESKSRCDTIHFNELLRITAIKKNLTRYPYRLEFIYPDFKFRRIAMSNEDNFFDLISELSKCTPEDFEINVSEFESSYK